jgi:hypothetical protein
VDQQGTLAGYEVKEYLMEKWGRKCAYCGVENVLLQMEPIVPKVSCGFNRISNLTMGLLQVQQKEGFPGSDRVFERT